MRPFPAALLTAVLLAEAALGLSGCGRKSQAMPPMGPPDVGVVVIGTEPAQLQTELPGRINPIMISDVRPQVSGIVLKRLFTEGAEVKAGQVLYEVDPSTYRAAVDQARGQVSNAEANATTTRLKAERYGELVKINAISRQDYDDARAAASQAQANVVQNKAALRAAQINLDYTSVRAPISGRIGRSTYTPGALVTAGQANALATIQQLDPMYVDLTQSSAELLRLERELADGALHHAEGATARVRLILDDGSTYPLEGRLEFTDVTVDPNSGTVNLRAVFPNPKRVLLPGMYVRAQITEGVNPNAILVPQQGVSRDPTGAATAYVVGPGGKAEMRKLTVGRAVGDRWLVTAGLHPGDRLIVDGLQRVRPGAPVHPVLLRTAAQAGAPPPGA